MDKKIEMIMRLLILITVIKINYASSYKLISSGR